MLVDQHSPKRQRTSRAPTTSDRGAEVEGASTSAACPSKEGFPVWGKKGNGSGGFLDYFWDLEHAKEELKAACAKFQQLLERLMDGVDNDG